MGNCFAAKIEQYLKQTPYKKLIISLFSLVFGILGALPYYYENLFIFTFVSLIAQFCLIIVLKRAEIKIFLPFFTYCFGFFAPIYLFLSELYPYERFGFTQSNAIFIVICSCILIPLLHTVIFSIIFNLSRYFNGILTSALGMASLWVISEWLLTFGTLAFPWCNMSVSLTGFLPFLQTASIFGEYFITFITVFSCYLISTAVICGKRCYLVYGISVIVLNLIIGAIIYFLPTQHQNVINVASIQGNVLSNEKWVDSNRSEIFNIYIKMAKEAAENGADVIALPESAIPLNFTENGQLHRSFAKITEQYDCTIISGISCYDNNKQYNSVIAVLPDGSLSQRYDKRHLVPFGEFIPFVDIFGKIVPFVGEFSADSGEYAEGDKPVIIDTQFGYTAPLVCFDSIFSNFSTEGVRNGAEFITVVTNDSWFNDSIGIYTHLRHSQIRAIENRRFVLRAANTGISAIVDEKGRILQESKPLVEDIVYAQIEIRNNNCLYHFIMDAFVYLCILNVIILIIYNKRRYKNGKNSASQNRDL